MEGYGWLLIILLVLVSGAIAYLGDMLGYRLGKKRVTLFNLRPRTTATLLSVAVGMAITILTLTAVLALSREARLGLFHINRLLQEQQELQAQVKQTQQALALNRKKVETLSKTSTALKAQLDTERKLLAKAQEALEATQAQYTRLKQSLAALEKRNKALAAHNKQLDKLQAQLEQRLKETEAKVAKGQQDLDLSLKQLAEAQLQMDKLSKSLEQETISLAMVREELESERTELSSYKKQLSKATLDLLETQRQLTAARARSRALEERRRSLEQEASALQVQVARYQQQLAEAELFNRRSLAALLEMRAGNIVFQPFQVLADVRVKPDSPAWYVKDQAHKLWEAARQRASAKVGTLPQGVSPLTLVVPGTPGQAAQALTDGQAIDFLTDLLEHVSEPSLVQLVCLSNTVEGEAVPVRAQIMPDRVLFAKGEVITTVHLVPTLPLPRLYERITQAITNQVRARAAAREPFLDPQAVHGVVSGTQLLEVLDEVLQHSEPVDVIIKARKLTRTLQPVQLEFEVKPAEESRKPGNSAEGASSGTGTEAAGG